MHNLRLAILTNFIPPYRVSLYRELARQVSHSRFFLSTQVEANRTWPTEWHDLNVQLQRNFTLVTQFWRYKEFGEQAYIHIPYDTISQLGRFRPDAVISAELGFRTIQAWMYRMLSPRTAFIPWLDLSEHTESDVGSFRSGLRRFLLSQADAVIVNGPSAERYAKRLLNRAEGVFVSPFTVDSASFPARQTWTHADTRPRRFLYVGRLIELKGLRPFLQALSESLRNHPGQEAEFWLAGGGPVRPDLESFPVPPNLHLHFLGEVPYNDLAAIYPQCDVLVLPTFKDTWGMVVNEGMASGLCVLGSDYSQAVEHLVREGLTGWRFRPDDLPSMQAAIEKALLVDSPRLLQMQQAASAAMQTLSPAKSADEMLEAVLYGIERRRRAAQGPVAGMARESDA